MVRSSLAQEKSCLSKGRCKYNPFKKCVYSIGENQTVITARLALILTALKAEDDLKDSDVPFFKKLIARLLFSHLNRHIKKLDEYTSLIACIKQKLNALSHLEKENSSDIDRACEIFGELMAEITAFGFEDSKTAIAREIGSSIGRYIYLIDAIDDVEKDSKSHSYNPLISKFGSLEETREQFNTLDVSLSAYVSRAMLAINLIPDGEYTRIINNILTMGLGKNAYKIMTENGDKK